MKNKHKRRTSATHRAMKKISQHPFFAKLSSLDFFGQVLSMGACGAECGFIPYFDYSKMSR